MLIFQNSIITIISEQRFREPWADVASSIERRASMVRHPEVLIVVFEPMVGEKQTVFESQTCVFSGYLSFFWNAIRNRSFSERDRLIPPDRVREASQRLQSWLRWAQTFHRAFISRIDKNRARFPNVFHTFSFEFSKVRFFSRKH